MKQNYKEGWKQGSSFERNNFAISKMNYLDDALDGYMQTFLTMKGKDSILLYDLNFQNGLLQGESKSYHLNGKISKRGFFLNGQSIDDYEAYDSLGFKYHYVKFLYSFPIEEKIWEENELSARYLFDWKDSIYFSPSDITSSESLDDMLSNLGYTETASNYYGRPTLVEKTGIDYHLTKYYPNDTIARDGKISSGKKVGPWKYFSYEGELLYKVDYADSIITINDSIQFKSKGILTDYNSKGNPISKSFIIEKFEKYDCAHSDHHEIRQLYTTWEANDTLKRINGYVKNHYDNGVIQNEGNMKNGLPTGIWKFYDPFGNLNQVGVYVSGKRDGRWLAGDLSKTKYLGDICLNPNLPNIENEIKMREKLLDIVITNYKLGKAFNKEYYDIDWNEVDKK
jgi:antitoxin component YwqK of YwqJK toxin-antitoxin module